MQIFVWNSVFVGQLASVLGTYQDDELSSFFFIFMNYLKLLLPFEATV